MRTIVAFIVRDDLGFEVPVKSVLTAADLDLAIARCHIGVLRVLILSPEGADVRHRRGSSA